MKLIKLFSMMFCALAAGIFVVPTASADDWNNRTTVTFSAPVEVPGAGAQVLPAGTYIFKLMDSPSDRNIVQIFSADGLHLYTTILAIANYRLRATSKTVMTFHERAEGQPEAIRAWFYPGANWGQEFVYPKSRAMELAKIVKEPILATPLEAADVPFEKMRNAEVVGVTPTGETVEMTKVIEPAPVAVAALPHTAGLLPLFGLIGLLSLVTGFALWMFSRKERQQLAPVSRRAI
jgi:hypothetical protein